MWLLNIHKTKLLRLTIQQHNGADCMSLIDKQAVADNRKSTGITLYTSQPLLSASAHDAVPWVLALGGI